MFIQITLLSERLTTILDQTTKWSFFRMYSHMVEQVVPFPESFIATFHVAYKNLGPPTRTRIIIFNISEFFGIGDTKLLTESCKINIISSLAFNMGIVREAQMLS